MNSMAASVIEKVDGSKLEPGPELRGWVGFHPCSGGDPAGFVLLACLARVMLVSAVFSRHSGKDVRVRAEIVKISSEKPEASLVRYAADQIRAGEVLGMPTDTFYGLAADPFNLRAVDRVYEIKSRSRHKPLSLLIESVDQAEELA